jgi:hypothetical protein
MESKGYELACFADNRKWFSTNGFQILACGNVIMALKQ